MNGQIYGMYNIIIHNNVLNILGNYKIEKVHKIKHNINFSL